MDTRPPLPSLYCPQCGAALSAGAAQGLCARCLMAAAAQPTLPSVSRVENVTVEQVAAAFPQLQVLEMIGQGGMGSVFKVRQPKLDRFAALKLLPQSLATDPAFAGRFEREARLLAKLSHPNIVAVYDYGQAGNFFYLLMEFVDGVNLRQAMRASKFEPRQALGIVPKICDALEYAHDEGVLHRDIKPENILLDTRGRVKLVDFGIAKLMAEPDTDHADAFATDLNLTQAGAALGTPSYMAPEQRDHPSDVDNRADIYSLGVVFYELLTGELPTGGLIKPSEKSGADPRVDAIVQQALQKERDRRQHSAGEVRTQVESLAGNATATKPTLDYHLATTPRFSRLAILGAVWAAFFLPLIVALFFDRLEMRPLGLGHPSQSQLFLWLSLLPLGLTAPFGATLLGWISVLQIKKSQGRLKGIKLAMFDGLVFPLLLLDAFILVMSVLGAGFTPHSFWSHFGPLAAKVSVVLTTLLFSLLADGWIIHQIWRALKNVEPGLPAMPPSTQDPATAASGESRFSRTAIVAAAWMTLFFAVVPAFVWHAAKTHEFENGGPFASPVMVFVFFIFILPAFAAPIATTLLGWISVSQIHHSVGRLYGLGLAVFDGLLFPLIALDYAVVFAERQILLTQFYQPISHLRQIFNQETGATLSIEQFGFLAGLTAILMLDVWVIRSVWRALTQLKVMPTSQAPRPPSPVAARSDTPALARFAAAFCGMAGLLAILAWFGMPHPQQNVVWGILGAAVLAVVFAFPVRQSRLGKRALLGGSTNIAVWFIIFAIFQFFVHSPTAMTGSTDFHCTVFEADAALVDKLIPQTQRSADRATESVQLVVEGNATRSVGPFTVVQAPQALTQAQTAIISQAIVDALMRGVDPIPGVLSDQSREVSTDWWHPGLPDVWSYSKAFKDYSVGGGATILLGYRKSEAADEIHIDCRLNHEENPTAGGSTELSSILYYEGKAPQNGALAFLVPYFREDNSTHYLVVVYQVGQESTPSIAAAEPVDSMPIIERVLEADNPDHRGLNLTSGEFAKSTPGHPLNFGNDGNNTLRDANVDVYFPDEPVEAHYLLSLDMRQCLFSSQPIADLQSITSNQIEQTLAKMKDWRSYMEKPGSPLGAMSTRLRNPTSHIVPDQLCTFTTRDGVDGVLQIVDYTDKPRNIKIRYKLVRSDLNAGHDLQNQEMSSSVQAAEEALAVKESQYKIGAISKYELQHQRDLVEELKAQATGDPVKALQAHLTTALHRQDDAGDRFHVGLAPASEYDMAKADADAIAAQLKKAQVYFDQPGTTRPSVQRWETPLVTSP